MIRCIGCHKPTTGGNEKAEMVAGIKIVGQLGRQATTRPQIFVITNASSTVSRLRLSSTTAVARSEKCYLVNIGEGIRRIGRL